MERSLMRKLLQYRGAKRAKGQMQRIRRSIDAHNDDNREEELVHKQLPLLLVLILG